MKPKSDNLFHFTKSLDVLKLILKDGVFPRYCLEDLSWLGGGPDHIAFPISCFCDIPLSRIDEHTGFYGEYGLGLSKSWGQKNGLEPVIYATQGGKILEAWKYFFYLKLPAELDPGKFNKHLYRYLSMTKPTEGSMVVGGDIIKKEFFQESEWRYVAPVMDLIEDDEFEDKKEDENKKVEKYKLQINPNDVRYIFVKSDTDIPKLVDFINSELGVFPHNDLKILTSRIVSLDTLRNDL